MNDKELADKVIDCRIGRSSTWVDDTDYEIPGDYDRWVPAKAFVRDWRVVGVLMGKVDAHFIERLTESKWAARSDKPYGEGKTREWYENESLPRAIIEACVEALS